MGSMRPTCRVVSSRDVTSQVEFGLISFRDSHNFEVCDACLGVYMPSWEAETQNVTYLCEASITGGKYVRSLRPGKAPRPRNTELLQAEKSGGIYGSLSQPHMPAPTP